MSTLLPVALTRVQSDCTNRNMGMSLSCNCPSITNDFGVHIE